MSEQPPIDALKEIGFSEIEAAVYCFLLQESPATGYRISHAIGKAPANTYKAIAALEQRGAILTDEGDSKLCRAVPYEELLDALESQFRKRKNAARAALAEIEPAAEDTRIYQLKTVDQVYSRAERMLAETEEIVMVDAFPAPFTRLASSFEKAAKRGVACSIMVYDKEQADWAGERGILALYNGNAIFDRWPGAQLTLIADARESLLALLARDGEGLIQGAWTNSRFMSSLLHSGAAAGNITAQVNQMGLLNKQPLAALYEYAVTRFQPPGLRELIGAQKRSGE